MSSAQSRTQVSFPDAAGAPMQSTDVVASRPRSSWRSRASTALLVIAGAGLFALGIGTRLADVRFNTVVSNSMQPTFSAGDLVLTLPVPVEQVHAGDVIAFYPPNYSQPVMHRVTSFVDGVLTTKGDANSVSDPWQLTPTSATAYRLLFVVPFAGWLSQLQMPLLYLALLFAGLAIVQIAWKEVAKRRAPQQEPVS